MIDPTKITNFNATIEELEEMILFWICAAGKNGVTAARCLDNLLSSIEDNLLSPFEKVNYLAKNFSLAEKMKEKGIGCYNNKAKSFFAVCNSNINLQTCSVNDLEQLPGIGPKTARCFLIHSRPDQELAGLDTHILKFLRDQGHEVPKSTPVGKKYQEIEKLFLKYAKESKMNLAEFDLAIWNHYRKDKTI